MRVRVSDPVYVLDLLVFLAATGFEAEPEGDGGLLRVGGDDEARLRSELLARASLHPELRAEVEE